MTRYLRWRQSSVSRAVWWPQQWKVMTILPASPRIPTFILARPLLVRLRTNNGFPLLKQVRKATLPPRVERLHRPVSPLAMNTLLCEKNTGRWRAFTTMAEPCRKIAVMVNGLQHQAQGLRQVHSRH